MTALASLTEADRAAVLVMLLDEGQAASVLAGLEPGELQLLGERMCALGEIAPETIANSIDGFARIAANGNVSAHGRTGQVHALMNRAVGEVKATGLMQRIAPEAAAQVPALELARWLTPQMLLPLVRDEHPQVLAVLLVQLDPAIAAQVLAGLPTAVQPHVVHRIATLGPVSPEAMAVLEDLLGERLAAGQTMVSAAFGGPKEAAEIVNSAGKAAEKRILPQVARLDRQIAKTIENEMFTFEHLFALDAQAMGSLLREVESEVLIDALKGVPDAQRDCFFRAMSSRAADGVRDEIEGRGRIKLAEVAEAQKAIVGTARRLAAEGVIAFGGGGDGEYV